MTECKGIKSTWKNSSFHFSNFVSVSVIIYVNRLSKDIPFILTCFGKILSSVIPGIELIKSVINKDDKIEVMSYDGLTIDFCKKVNADFIVRGVRNNGDFEFEKAIARTNRLLSKIETVFLLTSAKTSFISSSIVRDLIKNNGDYRELVPKKIAKLL